MRATGARQAAQRAAETRCTRISDQSAPSVAENAVADARDARRAAGARRASRGARATVASLLATLRPALLARSSSAREKRDRTGGSWTHVGVGCPRASSTARSSCGCFTCPTSTRGPVRVNHRGSYRQPAFGRPPGRFHARNPLREPVFAQTRGVAAQAKDLLPRKAAIAVPTRTTAESDAAILKLLAGGAVASTLIAERLGMKLRTVQYRLHRLAEQDLVIGNEPRGMFRLSGAGHARVLATRLPLHEPPPSADPGALARLPAEHHAFLRLLCDAVVARRALWSVHRSNWPGFVLLGPSKTGKTLLAELLCRRFGLDPATHIRVLPRETPGSIWGRRGSEPGGAWHFAPAPLLALPFAAFDEYDKASAELQRAAHAYLQGDSYFATEEEKAWVQATPLAILNADRGTAVLPDPYLRRSVVLDTTPLVETTADIDEVARALLGVQLERVAADVAPPEPALPEQARTLLRTGLRAALTDRGWRRVDAEPIARLALGRWATNPAGGADQAAFSVAADYLLCTATRDGEVAEDWTARLEAVATVAPQQGAAAAIASAGARSRGERERREAERGEREAAQASAAGKREELLELIKRSLASAPRRLADDEAPQAARARGRATYWRTTIRAARTPEELDRLEAIVRREVVEPIEAISRRHATEVDTAAIAKRLRAERRAAERDQKAKVVKYLAWLQELYRRSDPASDRAVVDELIRLHCVEAQTYETTEETLGSKARHVMRRAKQEVSRLVTPPRPAPAPDPIAALYQCIPYAYLGSAVPQSARPEDDREYETKTWTEYLDGDGNRHTAYDLRSWRAPAVKAVLRAAARRIGQTLKEPRQTRATSAPPRAARRTTPATVKRKGLDKSR